MKLKKCNRIRLQLQAKHAKLVKVYYYFFFVLWVFEFLYTIFLYAFFETFCMSHVLNIYVQIIPSAKLEWLWRLDVWISLERNFFSKLSHIVSKFYDTETAVYWLAKLYGMCHCNWYLWKIFYDYSVCFRLRS